MKELIGLEEMKEQLYVVIDDDDMKIVQAISAASAMVLSYTGGDDTTYETEADIPAQLKQATIVLVAHAHEDPFGDKWPSGGELPPSVRALLSDFHDPVSA